MEELKAMKKQLLAAAQAQMGNLEQVDAKELGEVIDMIKDLEEAEYYCSIVKAMDESKEEKKDNQKYDEIMTSLLARTGGNQNQSEQRYYTQPYYPMWDDPYMRRNNSRVYYGGDGGQGSSSGNSGGSNSGMSSGGNNAQGGGTRGYQDGNYQGMNRQTIRDPREGRSGASRRGYMEGKEQHQGKEKQIQELEDYMKELSSDITEMIRDASPEEKAILQQRLSTLATKILNA